MHKKESFSARFIRWSWIVLFVTSTLQLAFFGSLDNALATGCVILAWFILTKFILQPETLKAHPLPGFLILGFTTTQFYFPLVFTLLEGKPVVFNLDLPKEVFLHSLASQLVMIVSFLIYKATLTASFYKRPDSLLMKWGFFTPPKNRQLWLMGLTGLLAMYYIYFYSPSVGREVAGVGDKLIQGLIIFSYAPFFIPFGRMYGNKKIRMSRVLPMLIFFTLILFAISMGRNSRSAFMVGFTSVGFAYCLGLLLGIFRKNVFSARNVILLVAGLWLITGPLADLATAMVMVRSFRKDISRTELVELTLQTYKNKEAIRMVREEVLTKENDWDEHYMDNLFLARFSNLKYNDASLLGASKIHEQDQSMLIFTLDRFWANLPAPVLNFFGMNVDKESVTAVSFGDFLYYKSGADSGVLGGLRTGHFTGSGMAAFGWWYLLILGTGLIPVYYLLDKLFIRKKVALPLLNRPFIYESRFSLCGLLALTHIFMFLPDESVLEPYVFLMRGFAQMLLLYFVVFHFTRYMSILLPGGVTPVVRKHR